MTVQELLKPRYKVIADYPSHWLHPHIGIIQTGETGSTEDGFVFEYKNYPHLFKKLEWWEDLDFKDFPKYIKWLSPGHDREEYFKVINWYSNSNTSQIAGIDVEGGRLFIQDCLPATESEYLTYKQK